MYYNVALNTFKEDNSFELVLENKKETIMLGGTLTGCSYSAYLIITKEHQAVYEQSYSSPLYITCEDDEEYIREMLADQFVEILNTLLDTLWSWMDSIQFNSITVKEMTPRCQILKEEKIKIN